MQREPRDLLSYPRPSIAVDVVLLTIAADRLQVVLARRDSGPYAGIWMLPGTMLRYRERLRAAVLRCLETRMKVQGRSPQQLHVFDDPDRDERGWVLTVTHLDVLPLNELAGAFQQPHFQLRPIDQVADLPFSHGSIITHAVDIVRNRYEQEPDPLNILEEPFTMTQLRKIHDAVSEKTHQRDTFRRKMEPQLEALDARTVSRETGGMGRPARLYRKVQSETSQLVLPH